MARKVPVGQLHHAGQAFPLRNNVPFELRPGDCLELKNGLFIVANEGGDGRTVLEVTHAWWHQIGNVGLFQVD